MNPRTLMGRLLAGGFFLYFTVCPSLAEGVEKVRIFNGMCDASAAAYLGGGRFVMADDENNILRIYELAGGGNLPVAELDLTEFFGARGEEHAEADIEGCTQIGDTLYWITSHGRSKKGKWRGMRYQFFATQLVAEKGGTFSLEPKGKPFTGLLTGMLKLKQPSLLPYVGVVGKKDKSGKLAPKENGLNIESLCASDDGKIVYIGFRNPRPGGKAMLLPLLNPAELVTGKPTAEPKFGRPIYFDFAGLGFRAMEYSPFHGDHIIIAGSHDGKDNSHLYRWSGDEKSAARKIRSVAAFNPETVLVDPSSGRLRLFSDDGTVLYKVRPEESSEPLEDGMCECKHLVDPKKRAFRMVELELEK